MTMGFGLQRYTSQEIASMTMQFFSKYSFKILMALGIIVAGWLLAILFSKAMLILLTKKKTDMPVARFTAGMTKWFIVACFVLLAIGIFGISITPLIAGLSIVGFGASLALQGPLSNYASGVTLIFTKPFKVGDILEIGDWIGQVEDMSISRTLIRSLDGTLIVIPNKKIIGEVVHNYSNFKKLDIRVGISYDSDAGKAVSLIEKIVVEDKRVVKKPLPKIGIETFGESSVNLYGRLWCIQSDYWDLMFDINKSIYCEFAKNSIKIPFPQREVRIYEHKN